MMEPPPPKLVQTRPYARVDDLHAADTWLVCEIHGLVEGRAADPAAKRTDLLRRFDALQESRRRWFLEILDGPSGSPSLSCSTPDCTSPPA